MECTLKKKLFFSYFCFCIFLTIVNKNRSSQKVRNVNHASHERNIVGTSLRITKKKKNGKFTIVN